MRRVAAGSPEPLGVSVVSGGINVAVYSAHATRIELCLFDATGATEVERIALPERTGDVFHAFIGEVSRGARYGLRAHGPYDPRNGHRFNANKLLIDPYARALDGRIALHASQFGELPDGTTRNDADSAPHTAKAIVTGAWDGTPTRHRVAWGDTVMYEMHVRGFTRAHPEVPEKLRGTCAGLAHPAALAHLARLGVSTVELMPIAAIVDERHLVRLGLGNYWGYNPVAWLVPDPRLAPGGNEELARCVDALHGAGIEVVLDVVFNHSGEGDALGPTLSLRGLDNATYYRLLPGNAYADDAGCGNVLALDRAPVMRLALDAMRHYAALGIDGFRLDLATTLARRDSGFDPAAPLLQAMLQDPLLRDCKVIAEPWDIGPGGYRLGAFPADWGEWNDRFRDSVRRYWRGDRAQLGEFATRLSGSADIFQARFRPPSRSINFVTAHDGFTLADLVSYAGKHNLDNGENNRDGTDANASWNHGVEGATDDPEIRAKRQRDVRALLATLLLARGTPMLAMGDELARTQRGNNNAYAQDTPLAWVDWGAADQALIDFVARLLELRRTHPVLRAHRWLTGMPWPDSGERDVEWLHPEGRTMSVADWTHAEAQVLIGLLGVPASDDTTARRLGIAFNASAQDMPMHWPDARRDCVWRALVDTTQRDGRPLDMTPFAGGRVDLPARSVTVIGEELAVERQRNYAGIAAQTLDQLASAAGIQTAWLDVTGRRHVVAPDSLRAILAAMNLGAASESQARERLAELAVDPERRPDNTDGQPTRCFLPPPLRSGRRFGLATHLYSLRRRGDQGIGDFTTLAEVAEATARVGGVTVGINPLHALASGDRTRASPYHPSDRRFLDPIYVDVTAVPDLAASSVARTKLAAREKALADLRASAVVDYRGVWEAKSDVLAACFATFAARNSADPLVAEFEAFVAAGGAALQQFAIFEAIASLAPGVAWTQWDSALRSPDAAGIGAFAQREAARIRFALYLQWLADRQLATAATRARAAGLALGFYRDLAVGAAPDGAEAWSNPSSVLARGVSIGAPPDPFSLAGQVWNLPPPIPRAMAHSGFAAFRELLAANMRHAGALRIDHAAGLARLFWVPDGASARDGAYVHYPLEALLAVLAQESLHAQCAIVGEDLGTIPEGLSERLNAANVLSYRILWFEREGSAFRAPAGYAPMATACASTHDLPTIAGWWSGADLAEQRALDRLDAPATQAAYEARARDRRSLATAIANDGSGDAIDAEAPFSAAVAGAIHRHLARSASVLTLVQADDLAGEVSALNLPGTDRERPNWQRKVSVEASALWATPIAAASLPALTELRGGGTTGPATV